MLIMECGGGVGWRSGAMIMEAFGRWCLGATTVVGGALEVFGCIWCGVIVLGGVVKMQCDCHGGLGERRLGFCLR